MNEASRFGVSGANSKPIVGDSLSGDRDKGARKLEPTSSLHQPLKQPHKETSGFDVEDNKWIVSEYADGKPCSQRDLYAGLSRLYAPLHSYSLFPLFDKLLYRFFRLFGPFFHPFASIKRHVLKVASRATP
jgi:hypothetical protein